MGFDNPEVFFFFFKSLSSSSKYLKVILLKYLNSLTQVLCLQCKWMLQYLIGEMAMAYLKRMSAWVGVDLQDYVLWIFHYVELLQEGGPLPGPDTGLLSNTQKLIVRGDTCWQSKRFYWERAPGWRSSRWGNPGELLCLVARSLGFYDNGISFRVVFGQPF